MLVLTNTGDTVLTDVALTREDLAAGGSGYGETTDECAVGTNLGRLIPGASISLTCTTSHITNTASLGSGKEVINTAQAQATPYESDSLWQIIGDPLPDVTSSLDAAAVATTTWLDKEPEPKPPPPPPKPIVVVGSQATPELVTAGLAGCAIGLGWLGLALQWRRRQT